MRFIIQSRWVNVVVAFEDSDKLSDEDDIFVDNTGGSFEFAEESVDEPELRFGLRGTDG